MSTYTIFVTEDGHVFLVRVGPARYGMFSAVGAVAVAIPDPELFRLLFCFEAPWPGGALRAPLRRPAPWRGRGHQVIAGRG